MPAVVGEPIFDFDLSASSAAAAALRLAESNHRIANSLQMVSGVLRRQAVQAANANVGSALDCLVSAADRIETIGRVHRRLMDDGVEAVDLAALLRDIAQDSVAAFSAPGQTRLSLDLEEGCSLPARLASPVGLIVSELLANSLRHAHPTGVAGDIDVNCRRGECGNLLIEVADDGVGLTEGMDPKLADSFGMRLVNGLARQVGGELTFTDCPLGLTVQLNLFDGEAGAPSLRRRRGNAESAAHNVRQHRGEDDAEL
jgi:two-component sensor histidine kinase